MKVKRRVVDSPEYHSDVLDIRRIDRNDIYEKLFGNRYLEDLTSIERVMLGDAEQQIEKHERDWGIVYYEPYEALSVEHYHKGTTHTAKRKIVPGKHPDPNIPPILQRDCYEWSGRFPQDEFHKSPKRVRLMLAANKVGKTYGALGESLKLSFNMHPYRKMPTPNKGRIIGTDLEKGIEEDVWGIYQQLMPAHELRSEPRKHSGGQVKKVSYKCGSTVEFMSYEQDLKFFEGGEGDWVLFNEPPPRPVYTACSRWLMKRNGIIFIAATPLWEPWMYDEIFLTAGSGADQSDVFQLCAYENPYISDIAIANMVKDTPEDEIEARIFGAFKQLFGLVYKEFGQIHRIPAFKIPKDWSRFMVMDFHQRTPCALLWYAVDPKNQLYFYDELKIDKTIFEIAEEIKQKEKAECGRPVPVRWIDSIAATPDRATGRSAVKEFRLAGEKLKWSLNFRSSIKNRELGHKSVHEYLRVKNGVPGVYFFEPNGDLGGVPNAIGSMMHYQHEPEDDIWLHFADCIRYACVTKPKYSRNVPADPRGNQQQKADELTGYR